MISSVTICLVPEVKGGPFVFSGDLPGSIRKASALGFDAVEIFAPGPEAFDPTSLRGWLKESRLTLSAMGTGAGWIRHKWSLTSPDAAIRQQAEDFIRAMIDTAADFGAPAIIGSMQGHWGDDVSRETALGYLREGLNRLGRHASEKGVPLLYEPLNRYESNLLNTLADTADFLKTLATDNVKILADLFHMNIEEVDIAAAIRGGKGLIGHVHFVDSNRRPAGLGHLDFTAIAKALRDIGYNQSLSAEALAYPDPAAAAAQTIAAYRRFFA